MSIKLRAAAETAVGVSIGSALVCGLLSLNAEVAFTILAVGFILGLSYLAYEIRLTQLQYDEIVKQRLKAEEKK